MEHPFRAFQPYQFKVTPGVQCFGLIPTDPSWPIRPPQCFALGVPSSATDTTRIRSINRDPLQMEREFLYYFSLPRESF